MESNSPFQKYGPSPANKHDLDSAGFNPPTKVIMDVFWVQWRILTLPWQAVILGTTFVTSLLVKFLNAAGAPPVAFKDKAKLQESQKIMEHLHQREDGFRKRLKEVQAELDTKQQDCRRVEKKLAKLQTELVQKPMGRADSAQLPPPDLPSPSKADLHVLFWAAGALPAYWLLQQPSVPSISRKFVWSLIAPEGLIYTFHLMGSGPPGAKKIIPALSVFLSGFVFCHWLHSHC